MNTNQDNHDSHEEIATAPNGPRVSTDVISLYKSLGGGWEAEQQQFASGDDNQHRRTP
ncbi:MAG TPA: hypothetical protein VMF08_20610 [Candidatus Sulfotelmatobacter sp.]|nr:hypothetical protein [Candidatus Sulfotelmatobacter sp.]